VKLNEEIDANYKFSSLRKKQILSTEAVWQKLLLKTIPLFQKQTQLRSIFGVHPLPLEAVTACH